MTLPPMKFRGNDLIYNPTFGAGTFTNNSTASTPVSIESIRKSCRELRQDGLETKSVVMSSGTIRSIEERMCSRIGIPYVGIDWASGSIMGMNVIVEEAAGDNVYLISGPPPMPELDREFRPNYLDTDYSPSYTKGMPFLTMPDFMPTITHRMACISNYGDIGLSDRDLEGKAARAIAKHHLYHNRTHSLHRRIDRLERQLKSCSRPRRKQLVYRLNRAHDKLVAAQVEIFGE